MNIFGMEITTKKKLIYDVLINEGKEKAYNKYLELCKGHNLVDAIRFVDRIAANPKFRGVRTK